MTVPALRFLADRGMTEEHLAWVVVAQRRWSKDNPRAFRRDLGRPAIGSVAKPAPVGAGADASNYMKR